MAKSKREIAQEARDLMRAGDAFTEAALALGRALKLMDAHGHNVSYGQSVRESIDQWALDADRLSQQALERFES